MMIKAFGNALLLVVLWLLLLPVAGVAMDAEEGLFDLDLAELMQLQLSSANKAPTSLLKTAAAIYVITRTDIKRSGATCVPELLRMVPGLHVAQLDSNRWAISSRGFNGQFSNKLLVMIDGRSIYTPTFSGVYWDVQHLALDDIERIEVIRGPGAALWGANAVNGIIHILTRSAAQTQGTKISARVGTEKKAGFSAMHGMALSEHSFMRLSATGEQQGENQLNGDNAGDDSAMGRFSLRMDHEHGENSFQLSSSLYRALEGANSSRTFPYFPYQVVENADAELSGGYLNAQWKHSFNPRNTLELRSFYSANQRKEHPYQEKLQVFDLELQQSICGQGGQRFSWGGGVRYYIDDLSTYHNLSFNDPQDEYALINLFFQEEYPLSDSTVLTLGSKIEHNAFTGWEIQPNVRFLWSPTDRLSLWTAISRAVRTPSRIEADGHIFSNVYPPESPNNPYPLILVHEVRGSSDVKAEELLAYEFGVRTMLNDSLVLDAALFFNDYDSMRSGIMRPEELVSSDSNQPDYLVQYIDSANDNSGYSYGGELVLDWKVSPWWSLLGSYSYLEIDIDYVNTQEEKLFGIYTQQMFSLQSRLDLSRSLQLDAWLTYCDEIEAQNLSDNWGLTLRLGWKPKKHWQVELIGHNLLAGETQEMYSEFPVMISSEIERGAFLRIHYQF